MDIQKINKTIDDLPDVCADGKKAIRALVEEITGKKLAAEPDPKSGQIWKCGSFEALLMRDYCEDWSMYGLHNDFTKPWARRFSREALIQELRNGYAYVRDAKIS